MGTVSATKSLKMVKAMKVNKRVSWQAIRQRIGQGKVVVFALSKNAKATVIVSLRHPSQVLTGTRRRFIESGREGPLAQVRLTGQIGKWEKMVGQFMVANATASDSGLASIIALCPENVARLAKMLVHQ